MMRTNSRGSVVSGSELTIVGEDCISAPDTVYETPSASEITGASLTPPELFTAGMEHKGAILDSSMDETPKPRSLSGLEEESTPRAPSTTSHPADYLEAKVGEEAVSH
jgi:serine/threonine-protein kinase RIM15